MNEIEPSAQELQAEVAALRARVAELEAGRAPLRCEPDLRRIIESMPVLLDAFDDEGTIVAWNGEAERVTGYSAAEIIGNPQALELLYPDPDYRREMLARWRARGNDYRDWEWDLTAKDGTIRTVAWSNISDRFPIAGWSTWGVGVDVSARNQAVTLKTDIARVLENVLCRDVPLPQIFAELIRTIESQQPGMSGSILLVDEEGKHLRHGCALSLPAEYNELVDGIAIGPDMGSCGTCAFLGERVIAADIASDPLWHRFRAAALRHGLRACWSQPIRSRGGSVLGTFALYYREPRAPRASEVELIETAARLAGIAIEADRAETRLRREVGRTRQLLDTTIDGYILADRGGRIQDVNPAYCAMVGYSRDQLLGMNIADLEAMISPDDLKSFIEAMVSAGSARFETRHRHADGALIDLDVSITILDSTPTLLVAAFVRDITAEKRATLALKASEERFQRLLQEANDAIFLADAESGLLTDANERAAQLIGRPREEIIGLHQSDLHPATEKEHYRAIFEEHLHHGSGMTAEALVLHRDGHLIPVEISASVIEIEGRRIIQGIFRDITERQAAEQALRILSAALEQSPVMIMITDTSAAIEYVNPRFTAVTGYSAEEVLGKNPSLLKSGEMNPHQYRELWDTITRGRVWRGVFHNRRKDGALYWESASISPIRDGDGKITHFLGVKEDITSRRAMEADRRSLERQLRQVQKLETIGTLAGGIAHDFNNLLQAILGFGTIAHEDSPPDGSVRRDLEQLLAAAGRARDLVHQILTFSRQSDGERRPVQLHLVVREAVKLLRATIPATIEIRESIAGDSEPVIADASQIHQVVMNLCTNSYQAMGDDGGTLAVGMENVELAPTDPRPHASLQPGRYVCISVADSGCGMDPATLERIFDPFFTTKGVDEGTGLGLAVAHGIITSHGGQIAVESTPAEGSTFRVFLPVCTREHTMGPCEPQIATGDERVLFVDDDEAVARIVPAMLERLGYRVTVQTDPRVALELAGDQRGEFDVVIADQTMPHLSGLALARELGRIRPGLPVLLLSGFSESLGAADLEAAGIRMLIRKPIVARELGRALRSVLDSDATSR